MSRLARTARNVSAGAIRRALLLATLLVVLLAPLLVACGSEQLEPPSVAADVGGTADEMQAEGPHGRRLLKSGAFELEIGIFEGGIPAEYRAWAWSDGQPVTPSGFTLVLELARLGGRVDPIAFSPRGDHLVSTSSIAEPHSFEVSIEATHAEQRHVWSFESFEGRTQIDAAMAASLGVETETAGPATLAKTVTVYGRVRVNGERVREVRARFEGMVDAVYARQGSFVQKGQRLLRVESNESLSRYTIVAPIAGVVTQRDINPGELTAGRVLMTVTDTSAVWVELSIFPVDREGVSVGKPVSISPALGGTPVSGVVSLVETVVDRHDQSVVARVALEAAGDQFLPGTFVTAEVEVGEYPVALAVKRSAIQSFRNFRVVYAQVGDVYEVRMLDLGREAGEWVEVRGGLELGERYVSVNSHLIKADIGKSGAAHHH